MCSSDLQNEPARSSFSRRRRRTLKHNYIGTEHILLGLVREEEGFAARVLESFGVTAGPAGAQVMRIVGAGEEITTGQIPFAPEAKKVLDGGAVREALWLGHNYVGTEHILLGLVREYEGVAARILLEFDADSEKIRNEVIRMLSGPGAAKRGVDGPNRRGLDFTPADAFELAMRLAPLASEIKFEVHPRRHAEPTFRISCVLSRNDDVLT